ncbi:hypothetical protein EV424DRAFT_1351735 [Suillus variegatus]|nr:hypothetical protein EV424DRAFT_1351735 [Suillus variegatus]
MVSTSALAPTRGAQCVSSGLGHHFVSLKKSRDKKKSQTHIELPGAQAKHHQLLAHMQQLMKPEHKQTKVHAVDAVETVSDTSETDTLAEIPDPDFEIPSEPSSDILAQESQIKHCILPDKATDSFGSTGDYPQGHLCMHHMFVPSKANNNCVFIFRQCSMLPQVLLYHGLFPTAPSQPCMAVSVELLSFYRALFEQSCDAINALASALKTHYSCRGFIMTDARADLLCKGEIIQDPFCQGLGYAVQWYDILQVQIEHRVEEAVQNSHNRVATLRSQTEDYTSTLSTLCRGRCAPILIQWCPACFAGTMFGKPTAEGGDIHTAMDGNFHHHHQRAVKIQQWLNTIRIRARETESEGIITSPMPKRRPMFSGLAGFVSGLAGWRRVTKRTSGEAKVAADDFGSEVHVNKHEALRTMGKHVIALATTGASRQDRTRIGQVCGKNIGRRGRCIGAAGDCPHFYDPTYFLPKEYINHIGRCIEAQRKRPAKSPVPLVPDEAIDQCETAYEAADGKKQKAAMDSFNDTGIMQKYSMALLEHLFSLIPPHATVIALYDVGCVLARSLSKYDILPSSIVSRLRLATTAMHAYGHEWACQLVHNPRMRIGLGLSDGEGTERLWSHFAAAIGSEMQSNLGDWIQQRLKCGINNQGTAAQEVLDQYTPVCLKKELNTGLTLQADLDTSNTALQSTRLMLEKGAASKDTLRALEALEKGHDCLMAKVKILYASLNIHDQFPELEGINLDFVQLLLMACDLKMNIRKWAITSFFGWDKLDRAVNHPYL